MIKKTILLISLFIFSMSKSIFSQEQTTKQFYAGDGKINVVIAVIAVIFIGLIFYLIKLDRKISKLEKDIKK